MITADRMAEVEKAYHRMAGLRYRPAAPSDGFGNIIADLDHRDLNAEAKEYAAQFLTDDERMEHWVGCSDFQSLHILPLIIESVRLLNSGVGGLPWALDMLNAAVESTQHLVDNMNDWQREWSGYGG